MSGTSLGVRVSPECAEAPMGVREEEEEVGRVTTSKRNQSSAV